MKENPPEAVPRPSSLAPHPSVPPCLRGPRLCFYLAQVLPTRGRSTSLTPHPSSLFPRPSSLRASVSPWPPPLFLSSSGPSHPMPFHVPHASSLIPLPSVPLCLRGPPPLFLCSGGPSHPKPFHVPHPSPLIPHPSVPLCLRGQILKRLCGSPRRHRSKAAHREKKRAEGCRVFQRFARA